MTEVMWQKTITVHCLSLFLIVSRLGHQNNWLLGLGELLHDWLYLLAWLKLYRPIFRKVALIVIDNSMSNNNKANGEGSELI